MVMMFLRWSSRKKKIIMDCDFGFHLIYGARTTYVLAIKGFPGTHKFLFLDEGKWQHVKETTNISEGKMFSPGNLRATFDNPDYDKIIVKEKGVFTNFISPATKAMLRLLFEVVPLGLLVENVGGYSSDAHQSARQAHCKVAYGSKNEIIRFEETLYGSSRLKGGVAVGAVAQVFSFAFMPFLFLVSLRKKKNQSYSYKSLCNVV